MKLTITVAIVLLFSLIQSYNALDIFRALNEEDKDAPALVKSMKLLQRGPPLVEIKSRATVETEWIEQKLDHFDNNETRTWQMRYMVNDEHFVPGGPMFIYLGGEWAISQGSIMGGHFYDMARQHKGILFYTEHRYYGQSRPTSDLSVENLKYLHVKQALADLAHFIQFKRSTVPALSNSKVIMAGGSYSATMVAWFKHSYPDLLTGGWASSAPLLAKVNFLEYKEVVGRAMRELGSQQCYDRIQNGIRGFEEMFANGRGAEVKAMLKICDNFNENNDLDYWSLFGTISNIFSGLVQYQAEGEIPMICDLLMYLDDDDIVAMAKFIIIAFGSPTTCIDHSYKDSVDYYLSTEYRDASRPWYYQTCNEYGWYQTSASDNQPFGSGFPVTLYTTLCEDIYGSQFSNEQINLNAARTNADFNGLNLRLENVYMTHGALDPWHPMGHGQLEGATMLPRASHCADFGSISNTDSNEMRASKQRLAQLVAQWLADD